MARFICWSAWVIFAVGWSSVAQAGFGVWTNTAGGLWSTPANWSGGNVADGANGTADFSEIDITAVNTTVHLDTARTIGSLFFGDTAPSFPTNNWILDNNGSAVNILTLDVPAGPAPIYVSNTTATISAALAGTAGIIKGNSGTLVLSGTNTFTGGVTVLFGTLQLGSAGALNANGANAVTFGPGSNGKLNLNGNSITVSGLSTDATVGGPLVQNNGSIDATLTINNAADNTFGGELRDGGSGRLSLTKTGAGALNLAGANTYTGVTALSAGMLAVGNDSALGSGPLNLTGGTIQADGAARVLSNALTLGGDFSVGGSYDLTLSSPATLTANRTIAVSSTGIATLSGTIGQDIAGRSLTKLGAGTLRLSGSNAFSGGMILNGGTLLVGSNTALGSGALIVASATIEADGGPRTISNPVVFAPFSMDFMTVDGSQDLTFVNRFGESDSQFNVGLLTKNGTGTLTLADLSNSFGSFNFNVNVNAGALVLAGQLESQYSTNNRLVIGNGTGVDTVRLMTYSNQLGGLNLTIIIVNSSGILDLNGKNDQISSLTFNGGSVTTGAGTLTLNSGGSVTTLANSQTATISGHLNLNAVNRTFDVADGGAAIDLDVSANVGNGSLTKAGAGTLRLSGTNTFSDGVTMNAGTLLAASNSALGSPLGTGALTINGGAVDLSTFASGVSLVSLNAGSLSMIGNLTIGVGGLLGANPTIAANQTVSLSGTTTIDPAHTLTLNSGTLNTGALTGTGTFNFINGTLGITGAAGLTIGSGGPLGTTVSLGAGDHLNVTNLLHVGGAGRLTNVGGNVLASNVQVDTSGRWTVTDGVQSVGTGLLNHGTLVLIDTTINGPVTSPAGSVVNVVGGVTFNQLFSGAGQFFGSGTTAFNGGYNPGDSPATVEFQGSVVLGATNTLAIELADPATGPQYYDQVHVAEQLLLGGTLQVSLLNGFMPLPGQSFDILDWSSRSGTFATLQLPALSAGLSWNTSQLYTDGVLSVGRPGDYNSNAVVDAADYVVWRKNVGTSTALPNDLIGGTIGTAQYNQWRANFGQSAPGAGVSTSATANAAVPEPMTSLLLMFAAAGWCLRRRRAE